MDAQLDDDVDQPQKDYFITIAKRMPADANIILCGPEPGWLYTLRQGNNSLKVIDFVAWIALNHCPGAVKIPLVISGDTHHYSRYSGNDGMTQFVTSGGGGAFLHPTHQLAQEVDLDREADHITWMKGYVKKLTLATFAKDKAQAESVYPSRADSKCMLAGNFAFPYYNPGFGLVLGVIYWLLAVAGSFFPYDTMVCAPLLLWLGFWGYTKKQEGGGTKVLLVSAANGVMHTVALLLVAHFFSGINQGLVDAAANPRTWFALFAVEMIVVGGFVAAEIFGIYLYVSSGWLDLSHNDAFSSMRRDSHRNFIRMRIKDDEVTLYPIGITKIPKRADWRHNDQKVGTPAPAFVPAEKLEAHLIEPGVTSRPLTSRIER